MVRTCLIGPTYPYRGGIAQYTTLLAQHLAEEHEVLLISFKRQYPRWLFPGPSDKDPSDNPLRSKVEYLIDPLNPISWQRTSQRIGQWEAEVVIIPWWVTYWTPSWSVMGRGVKRLRGRPKLLFICHNVLPHESSFIDRWAVKAALGPGDGFIVHARSDAERLLELIPAAKIKVTPLPTYAAMVTTSTENDNLLPAELPVDRSLLLFCGFVRPYKGLDVLIEALPTVLAERSVHLLIAGEFWKGKEAYLAQIKRLGLDRAVTIVDRYLTNEELAAYIIKSNVVVLPYRSATQSAVIQASFGLNRPVISTKVGGIPDVVEDGRTGLLVPAEDPEALAAAINQFLSGNLEEMMVENIQQEKSRFSWNHLINALDELAKT